MKVFLVISTGKLDDSLARVPVVADHHPVPLDEGWMVADGTWKMSICEKKSRRVYAPNRHS